MEKECESVGIAPSGQTVEEFAAEKKANQTAAVGKAVSFMEPSSTVLMLGVLPPLLAM